MDACPVIALGCPIRTRWRSGRSNHGLNRALAAHPMVRSCPPNAWRISRAATIDRDRFHAMIARKIGTISVAGTASGCMRWLGGTTPEVRDHLPAMLAPEGAAWDSLRGRSASARLDVMAVACVPRDGARARSRRFRSHHDGGRMRSVGMRLEGVPGDDLSRQWMPFP